MTLVAISFYATHMHFVRALWRHRGHHPVDSDDERNLAVARQGCEEYVGGTFVVFDWEQDRVTWQLPMNGAAGFCWRDGLLYLNMMRLCETVIVDGVGREQHRISHRAFNNLHTVVPTRGGFLYTSSGIDTILEVDHSSKLLYQWCALDHGYNLLENGQARVLDWSLDQRYVVYITGSHVTHVNSACIVDASEREILATLFQQGIVVSIDRRSGKACILLEGLKRPHDVRPYPGGGWVVSNTAANETLVLDEDWYIRRRIARGFNWVQSSAPLSDGSIVIADANNHRLVRVYPDERKPDEIRAFPRDWKVFLVQEVPAEYRDFFQHPIVGPPL